MDETIREDMESTKAQMRKGILEYAVLLVIARGKVYASDILRLLKEADLLVVEGTIYPLLSRLKKEEMVEYFWEESKTGPPRKYYSLTKKGRDMVRELGKVWTSLEESITSLQKN